MTKTIYQIALIDGVSQILMCPEMEPDENWTYRVKYLDEDGDDKEDLPASLTEWREFPALGKQVTIPSMAPPYRMVVECAEVIPASIAGKSGGELIWSKAALRELGLPSARFSIQIMEDVVIGPESETTDVYLLRAMASVRGGVSIYDINIPKDLDGAFLYNGKLKLSAGEEYNLEGKAIFNRPENILTAAGDFITNSPRVRIKNLTPSSGDFSGRLCQDSRCRPLAQSSVMYMAATGEKLTDEENKSLGTIMQLMKGAESAS